MSKSSFTRRFVTHAALLGCMMGASFGDYPPGMSWNLPDLRDPGNCRPNCSYESGGHSSRPYTNNDYAHKSKVVADRRKKKKSARKAKRNNRRK